MGKAIKSVGSALGLSGNDSAAKALARQQQSALEAQQAQQALANSNVAADSAAVDTAGTADAQNASADTSTRRRRGAQSLASSLGLNT